LATPDRGAPQVRQTLCRGSSTVAVHSRSCMKNICSTVHPDTRGSSYACTMGVSAPPPPCDVIWPSTPFKKNVGPAPITSHPPAPPPPRSPGCDGNVAPRGAGSATSRLAESFKFLTQILHVRSCIRSGQKSFPPTHPHPPPRGHSDELSDSWGAAAPQTPPQPPSPLFGCNWTA
jgi:hypothetical protein